MQSRILLSGAAFARACTIAGALFGLSGLAHAASAHASDAEARHGTRPDRARLERTTHAGDDRVPRALEEAEKLLRQFSAPDMRCRSPMLGSALGGIIGGLIGGNVADEHPGAGAAAGASVGIWLGHLIGQSVDNEDPECADGTNQQPKGPGDRKLRAL